MPSLPSIFPTRLDKTMDASLIKGDESAIATRLDRTMDASLLKEDDLAIQIDKYSESGTSCILDVLNVNRIKSNDITD